MDLENYKRIEHVSTEKFCRLCFMDNDLLINLSEKVTNDGLMISDLLVKNLGLELTDEELPKLVCSDCLEEVMQFDSIRPDIRETLAYMICRGKYLKMAFTKDKEAILNPYSMKQDIRYQHESCFSSISTTDQRFSKNGCTNLDVGSTNPTFNKTSLHVGDNLKYRMQNSRSKFFYHCKKCDDHFFNMDRLNHHFSLFHSKDNKYACGRCEKRFKSKIKLVKHIKKYDFQCVAKGCRVKEVIKSDSVENVFIVTNVNSEFVEEETEILKSNNSAVEVNQTILGKEYNDCKRYLCSHCGALFVGEELLKRHLITCPYVANEANGNPPTKLSPLTSTHATNITSNSKDPDIWYKCGKCSESFLDRKHVICHLKEKHNADRPNMCNICNVGFCSRLEVGLHQSVHKGEKLYTCKTCGANIHDKYYFKSHVLLCGDKKVLYKCNHCGKCFVRRCNLKVHTRTHFLERKYACKYCPNRFKGDYTLLKHVRAIHLKMKPYECGICHKAFAQSNILQNHISSHSDERPFVCEVCNRGFKLKHQLAQHRKRLHARDMKVTNDGVFTL